MMWSKKHRFVCHLHKGDDPFGFIGCMFVKQCRKYLTVLFVQV